MNGFVPLPQALKSAEFYKAQCQKLNGGPSILMIGATMNFVLLTQEAEEAEKTLGRIEEFESQFGKKLSAVSLVLAVVRSWYYRLKRDYANAMKYSALTLALDQRSLSKNFRTRFQNLAYHYSNVCQVIAAETAAEKGPAGTEASEEPASTEKREEDKEKWRAKMIKELEEVLEDCRVHCSLTEFSMQNVGTFYYFLQAEYERFQGRAEESLQSYNLCVEYAKVAGYLQHEAIALERLAELHGECGRHEVCELLMEKAIEAYERWGALPKAKSLREEQISRSRSSVSIGDRNMKETDKAQDNSLTLAPDLESSAAVLSFLMKDEEGLVLFEEFLSLCFCKESLYFVQEIQRLRQMFSKLKPLSAKNAGPFQSEEEKGIEQQQEQQQRIKQQQQQQQQHCQEIADEISRIVGEYILCNSILEINIDGSMREEIRNKVCDILELDFEEQEQEKAAAASYRINGSGSSSSSGSNDDDDEAAAVQAGDEDTDKSSSSSNSNSNSVSSGDYLSEFHRRSTSSTGSGSNRSRSSSSGGGGSRSMVSSLFERKKRFKQVSRKDPTSVFPEPSSRSSTNKIKVSEFGSPSSLDSEGIGREFGLLISPLSASKADKDDELDIDDEIYNSTSDHKSFQNAALIGEPDSALEKKLASLSSIFDAAYNEIWSQLASESIPRFVQTPEFNSYKNFKIT